MKFKTLMHISGIGSIIIVVAYQCILIKYQAPLDIIYDLGVVFNILLQGIFVSYIVYLLIEKTNYEKRLSTTIKMLPIIIKNLIHYMQSPYWHLASHSNIKIEDCFKEGINIDQILGSIKTNDLVFMDYKAGGSGYRLAYQGIYEFAMEVIKITDEALRYCEYYDEETFEILQKIRYSAYLTNVEKSFSQSKEYLERYNESIFYFIGPSAQKEYIELSMKIQKHLGSIDKIVNIRTA